jgi:hypothetical protein
MATKQNRPTPKHHKPLPKRFNLALTEEAYANLRVLADESGLGNNYVLTVLLEEMDRIVDRKAFSEAVTEMIERHRKE